MYEDNDPADSPVPTSADATPPSSPRRDSALVRFTAGAGGVFVGLATATALGPDEVEPCSVIGLVMTLAVVAGAFHVGRWFCQRWHGRQLVERNRFATVASGAIVSGICSGAFALIDRPRSASTAHADAVTMVVFLLATAAGPWWVYRSAAARERPVA